MDTLSRIQRALEAQLLRTQSASAPPRPLRLWVGSSTTCRGWPM